LLHFAPDDVRGFAARLYQAAGVSAGDASTLGDVLVQADLRGYPGHGVAHLPSYLDRIASGQTRLDAQIRVVREGKTTAVIDADFAIGQLAGRQAMGLAIDKAREHGVGIVGLMHSGHIGRAADYVEMAAEAGMVGVVTISVGGGNVVPYGARDPLAGTNPVAYGVPGPDGQHIILDFATSAMSMGELQHHAARGLPFPEGIMIDADGNPTTDYEVFRGPPRGHLLAFGGHKGAGIQLMTDILGGILVGNGPGRDWRGKGEAAINGVLFQAISVEEFQPLEEFQRQIGEQVRFIHDLPPAPGFEEVLVPGERGRKHAARAEIEGIEIDPQDWEKLLAHARRLEVTEIPTPRDVTG
jgi:L-lactate dehydrogenase